MNKKISIRNLKLDIENFCQRQKGFSLVEVMFAILFLTVIVFGVTKLQTGNLVLSKTNVNEMDAYFLANQGVEIAVGLGYPALAAACPSGVCHALYLAGPPYTIADTNPEEKIQTATGGIIFTRTVLLDNTDLIDAFKVTARITWRDSTGKHECDKVRKLSACEEVKRIVF